MPYDVKKYEADPKLVYKGLDALDPVMLMLVKELLIAQPMVVPVETKRSGSRQNVMFKTGKSKTDNSLHEEGKAMDYLHKIQGYSASKEWWMGVRKSWSAICARHGFKKIAYPNFEMGHISLNDGTRC